MKKEVFKTKNPIDVINDSRSVEECYPHLLEVVFSNKHKQSDIRYNKKTENLNLISRIYGANGCAHNSEIHFKLYQLFKKIKLQKAYEIFENKNCCMVLERILNKHFLWIENPQYWKKPSRNPYKQVESLILYLFAEYDVPKFLIDFWYDNSTYYNSTNEVYYKWFFHLSSGKSGKNLPNIYFKNWTKRMAHDFISIKESITPVNALIKTISKNNGGNNRLYPYFYIAKIQEGILSKSQSEFWYSFIEYFSKQGMFDYEHISHVADYVYHIKFENSANGKPENPNYEIKKKNLNTVLNEADIWMQQLQRLAKALGIARRNNLRTEQIAFQKKQLETTWDKAHNFTWEHTRTVKVGKEKEKVTYIIKELNSGQELFNEGRTMNHCVYSYAGSCISRKCRIYSLREKKTGGSILTIEVRDNILVQIRGKSNRRMNSDEQSILQEWCKVIGYRI